MSKTWLVISLCATALTFSALSAGSASAATAGWMVNKVNLAAGEVKTLAPGTNVLERFVLTAAQVTITCNSVRLKGASITGLNKALVESFEFGECSANENCEVASGGFDTQRLLSEEVTLDGNTAGKMTFVPETGETVATIKFNGSLCLFLGVQPLKGKVAFLAPTLQEERTVQRFNAVVPAGELTLGTAGARLTGATDLEVNGSQTWSFL